MHGDQPFFNRVHHSSLTGIRAVLIDTQVVGLRMIPFLPKHGVAQIGAGVEVVDVGLDGGTPRIGKLR